MKHLSLASRYRPQKFSEVIGQHLATTALSRAAAEDRVAPAYLLSGTRGVGKTTIARIFAKALNCANAPTAEPCNECSQCVQITNGNHVDVKEIDGASNTGVDDVRALRENIGYMPMEGRYKIFIVDEAHMLSKSAFNALLKTLEEPPAHTVFIFATTEAHRFPATIISRCQHFVFRHLPEDVIFAHLRNILDQEKIEYDEGAVHLLARRAAGSARDSLSLLDQVLSLCAGRMDMATARESLGLAGQDFYEELFTALAGRSCADVVKLCRQLLQSGVDIGFFTRELASNLRNLFLFRQAGEAILPALGLGEDEALFIKKHAASFSPMRMHASWQMTLDRQKDISQNPEPGSALELLLINLALLPQLLPVDQMENIPGQKIPTSPSPTNSAPEKMEETPAAFSPAKTSSTGLSWQGFCEFCKNGQNGNSIPHDILGQLESDWTNGKLTIKVPGAMLWTRLKKKRAELLAALNGYCGNAMPEVTFVEPKPRLSPKDQIAECAKRPEVELCQKILDATISSCQAKK